MATIERARNIVITSVVATALVGLGASLAFAATGGRAGTWTVTPGGSATAKSGKVTITDTATGAKITCTSSSGAGVLKSGSGLSGAGLGHAPKPPIFKSCTGEDGDWAWNWDTGPWPVPVNAVAYNPATGVATGTISGLHVTGTSKGCSLVIDGTGATADNGKVKGTYTNATGQGMVLASGGNLHFYNVSGCAGLFNSGDAVKVSGSFTVSPRQTATSP